MQQSSDVWDADSAMTSRCLLIRVRSAGHTKADCVASQVRLFGTEVPEGINYAQKRKTLEVSLACLTRPNYVQGTPRESIEGLTSSARSSAAYGYSLVWHYTKP